MRADKFHPSMEIYSLSPDSYCAVLNLQEVFCASRSKWLNRILLFDTNPSTTVSRRSLEYASALSSVRKYSNRLHAAVK